MMTNEMMESVYQESFSFWDKITDADREYIRQNSYPVHYPKGKIFIMAVNAWGGVGSFGGVCVFI